MNAKEYIEEFDYQFLYEEFEQNKIDKRVDALSKRALAFIEHNNYENIVGLSKENLLVCVIDYFTDIYRLKKFHKKIKHINLHKIYSYAVYWWLRRKPLQIIDNKVDNESLVYVNEKFMTQFIIYEMVKTSNEEEYKGIIEIDKNENIEKKYFDEIEYFLRYRIRDAYSIELAFQTFEFSLKLFSRAIAKQET